MFPACSLDRKSFLSSYSKPRFCGFVVETGTFGAKSASNAETTRWIAVCNGFLLQETRRPRERALVTKIDVFILAAGMMPLRATTPGAPPGEGLSGLYFNSKDLSGSPMMRRTDRQIDFA